MIRCPGTGTVTGAWACSASSLSVPQYHGSLPRYPWFSLKSLDDWGLYWGFTHNLLAIAFPNPPASPNPTAHHFHRLGQTAFHLPPSSQCSATYHPKCCSTTLYPFSLSLEFVASHYGHIYSTLWCVFFFSCVLFRQLTISYIDVGFNKCIKATSTPSSPPPPPARTARTYLMPLEGYFENRHWRVRGFFFFNQFKLIAKIDVILLDAILNEHGKQQTSTW